MPLARFVCDEKDPPKQTRFGWATRPTQANQAWVGHPRAPPPDRVTHRLPRLSCLSIFEGLPTIICC